MKGGARPGPRLTSLPWPARRSPTSSPRCSAHPGSSTSPGAPAGREGPCRRQEQPRRAGGRWTRQAACPARPWQGPGLVLGKLSAPRCHPESTGTTAGSGCSRAAAASICCGVTPWRSHSLAPRRVPLLVAAAVSRPPRPGGQGCTRAALSCLRGNGARRALPWAGLGAGRAASSSGGRPWCPRGLACPPSLTMASPGG